MTDATHVATRGDGLEVRRCTGCRLAYLATVPTDLSVFYDPGYFSRSPVVGTAPAHSGYENYERAYSASSFRWITELLRCIVGEPRDVFDLGAATGTFLDMARLSGFAVRGSELTATGVAAAAAKGIELRHGPFDPHDWEPRRFQVMTAFEVLEHVSDPRRVLEGLKTLLADDGALLFSVPNVTDAIIDRYGDNALDFNKSFDHVMFFNPEILTVMCDEIFGPGALRLFTADAHEWDQDVSFALGVVRPNAPSERTDDRLLGILDGTVPGTEIRTVPEARAVALGAAKFSKRDLVDDAFRVARELGATDHDLATTIAQVLRNRGELYRAISVLEDHIKTAGSTPDVLAAPLLVALIDDVMMMLGNEHVGAAGGLERMHERLEVAIQREDELERAVEGISARAVLSDEERDDLESRVLRAETAARDLRSLLEDMDRERRITADRAAEADTRVTTLSNDLNSIYASRAWRTVTAVRRLKGLAVGRSGAGTATESVAAPDDHLEPQMLTSESPEADVTVSVIMPVYNKGTTLAASIDSLLSQTYQHFEIIVWDDGSTDDLTKTELAAVGSNPKVTVVYSENQGVIGARNAAMRLASGEFLMCLDPDDEVDPTYLEKAVLYLRTHPDVDIVYPWQATRALDEVWETQDLDPRTIADGNHVPVCAMFRRTVFETTGGFSAAMADGAEDWEFWTHAAAKGFVGRVIREPLFRYRYSDDPTESRDAAARDKLGAIWKRIKTLHPTVEWLPRLTKPDHVPL
ncbi:MAG: glycosyltransferase, partial [Acidimicrobiia bacterium]|nr:glycosyltransferase [Acidimicrobiia bacterium]